MSHTKVLPDARAEVLYIAMSGPVFNSFDGGDEAIGEL